VAIALETVSVYHAALREQYLADTNEALSGRLRRHVLVAGGKERAGLAGPSDTFRAQIRLKDAEDSVYQSRGAFDVAAGRLRHLLALPAETEITLRAATPPALNLQNAEQLAIDHSSGFQQLRGDHLEAQRAARIAANRTLPDISLNLSYGQAALAESSLQSLIPATQRQWGLFLQSSGDLNRTAEKLNLRRALLRLEALEVALADKAADIRRELRQQLRAIEIARARIGLREEQIRQADGKLALAEVKFAHDKADNFELIEAESDLHRARIELSAAETDYALAAYALMAMTGQFPR
jgi:outer membrane protein TolC